MVVVVGEVGAVGRALRDGSDHPHARAAVVELTSPWVNSTSSNGHPNGSSRQKSSMTDAAAIAPGWSQVAAEYDG